jgi:hypothetical protein
VAKVPEHMGQPCEQQYAGEILAYLMQVVLGKAGNPAMREVWYARAADARLDFDLVYETMTNSNKDRKQYLVLDNNIRGLSKVLYHYNIRLNLFKGKYHQESVFPSAELLSIRMMLLQKIHRGEKVNMEKLLKKKKLMANPEVDPADIDPGGTGLNASEIKLLKDVIDSEPFFMDYLENPFIVDTLYRVGVVNPDNFVKEKISRARYQADGFTARSPQKDSGTLKISILPSITKAFEYQNIDATTYPSGFKPNKKYAEASQEVQEKILNLTQQLVKVQLMSRGPTQHSPGSNYDALAKRFVDEHLEFLNHDRRPFVIYPENADRMIESICPEAAFTIIILGENVYLSLNINEVDSYPNVNRVYLDIQEIRHSQVDYELSQVSMFVYNKLKTLIPDLS